MGIFPPSRGSLYPPVKHRFVELTTGPTQEPVSVEDARLWTVHETESLASGNLHRDDELVREILIPGVRRKVENWLAESLITQTRTAYYDAADLVSSCLQLPYGPLQSVTSVKYTTTDGTLSTFSSASYYTMTGRRSQLALNEGYTWPSDLMDYNSLQVEYVCGYGASSIGTPDYKDTGANGAGNYLLSTGGTFCGGSDVTYTVTCDGDATFKASNNSGVNYFTSTETITTNYQLLQMGVYIKFPTNTGYVSTDTWDIECTANGVPQHYQAAIMQLVRYILMASDGFSGDSLNQVVETSDIPPAIKLILGNRIRI